MLSSRLIVAAAAVTIGVTIGACATNPATGRKQLILMSEGQEAALGKEADQQAVGAYGLYPDDQVQAYVAGLGRKLAAASEKPSLPWSFKVVDDPTVNAFALPGGYIYVTRGLMTHLRTEAELVSVLGHEIGHVTGRHSASQMSKQQLAMGGLIVGMAVEPELQRFGGLAQQGLSVLFLKFGRDDENEADELGLRYMTREAYDPREMIEVFGVLDRVGRAEGGAGRMPEWLSTHPNPGNRQTHIKELIAKTGATGSVVNRDAYLRRLDGMVFGDNPREGYFQGQAFYHPDLRFQLAFPPGFKTQNQRQAVAGVSQGQDAMVALTLTAGSSPEEAARKFLSQQGLQAGRTSRDTIGGLPAHEAFFEVATEQGALRGQVAFVAYDGKMYRLLAYTSAARFASYQKAFDAAIRSFAPLREARYLDVQPKRIDLVKLDREMALAEFARVHPSTVEVATIGLINGVDANQPLVRGLLAKRVVGGRLPN